MDELFEYALQRPRVHAKACVCDDDVKRGAFHGDSQSDLALRCELERVRKEIGQNLGDANRVAAIKALSIGTDADMEANIAIAAVGDEGLTDAFDHVLQTKSDLFQFKPASLQPRQVQQVVQ